MRGRPLRGNNSFRDFSALINLLPFHLSSCTHPAHYRRVVCSCCFTTLRRLWREFSSALGHDDSHDQIQMASIPCTPRLLIRSRLWIHRNGPGRCKQISIPRTTGLYRQNRPVNSQIVFERTESVDRKFYRLESRGNGGSVIFNTPNAFTVCVRGGEKIFVKKPIEVCNAIENWHLMIIQYRF